MVPRALVVLRLPRGAPVPAASAVREAILADRQRLGVTGASDVEYRLAGPYAIEIDGQALDEYVAWEI
jgi:hypothetical protein